jgi:hypothetical protein
MNKLKEFGCTPEKLSKTEVSKIKEIIFEVNFNNKKSENI